MLKRTALLALLGAGTVSAQPELDPVCENDADCETGIACNLTRPARGVADLYYCNQPDCADPEFARYRVDGICNNLDEGKAYYGALHQQQIREGAPSRAATNPSAGALDVSDLFLNTMLPTPNTYGMSNLLIIFGQFVDHDITLVEPPTNPGELRTTTITGTGSISRIIFPQSERIDSAAAPEFVNGITATLDLTQVYGSEEERGLALRQPGTPLLRVQRPANQDRDFLPDRNGLPDNVDMAMGNIPGSFAAGDVRANEQAILTAYHTLFVREHNKLALQFEQQFPAMSDDEIFELARARNIAQYQNIVFNEFLPGLVGGTPLPNYAGYDSSVNPQIGLGFATALYRMGHSGVSNDATAIDSQGVVTDRTLADVFFAPQTFLDQRDAVGAFLLGSKQTCHEALDLEMNDSLRRLLFANVGDALDLGALNVQRGVDHELMSLNDIRTSLGMPTRTVNEMTSRQCVRDDISSMFNSDVDAIPLFVAGLSEDPEDNSQLGPTISAALVDQFRRLRDGDRFYFENTVNGLGLDDATIREVRSTTLANIIQRNTFITPEQIGVRAFESEQCCFRGGKDSPNMMCVRSRGAISMQVVDPCDVEDMATSGAVFYPGTIDPATNTQYDCNCLAANVVSGSSKVSAAVAFVAATAVSVASLLL